MKVCPICNHQYSDGGGDFCVRDGTALVTAVAAPSQAQGQPLHEAVPQAGPVAGAPLELIKCDWCQGTNESTALACRYCGAPLDIENLVSDSGWREAPRIRDMTEIHFGGSTCQVEGEIVPVAEISLGQGDSVFFEHHVLLWKDDRTPMTVMPLQGGMKRAIKPTALLFKDPTVRMQLHIEQPGGYGGGFWSTWSMRYLWLMLFGPGRVAVQSAFKHMEDNGRYISGHSGATSQQW